ncbi:MAG: NBR1-Ig-like domain-containing protein [Flexilinea sp.]
MKKSFLFVLQIFIFSLILSSCSNTPYDLIIRNTDKAATEQLNILETAAAVPPTNSPAPVIANTEANTTVTPIILPTTLRYANTTIPTASGSSYTTTSADSAALVSFSPVSNTNVLPGQVFYLTVQLNNTGTTTWSTGYDLVFYNGTQLAYSSSYPLSSAVGTGTNYTTSIYMTSPSTAGTYTSSWYLADAYGTPFFYFSYVLVVGDYTSLTSVASYTPTITITPIHTTTPHTYLDYMCSSVELSLQQREGCETYCKYTVPYKVGCYYMGILNSTATTVPTSTKAPTATPTAPPASPANSG